MERVTVAKVQKTATGNNQRQIARKPLTSYSLSGLQQSIGNQAVQRLIRSPYIQTKLQISTPGDPFEREADRVADTVMRMPDPVVSGKRPTGIQTKPLASQITPLIHRQMAQPPVEEEEEVVSTKPLLQLVPLAVREDEEEEEQVSRNIETNPVPQEEESEKTIATKAESFAPIQRQTKDEDREKERLSVAPAIQRRMKEEEEEEEEVQTNLWPIQRACTNCEEELVHEVNSKPVQLTAPHPGSQKLGGSVAKSIAAMNGGNPLPPSARAFFEPRFGADFSKVRVHTDPHAAQTAKAINARAFTVGPHIAFGASQFAPESQQGKQILAHELTHVIQQGAATSSKHVHRAPEMIQTFPQAGVIPPVTDKQRRHYKHADDVVDIQGQATFKPGDGLGNYIASRWENGDSDVAVNIKFGALGSGFIFVKRTGRYTTQSCLNIPLGLLGPTISICEDVAPESQNYKAELQTIPLKHPALESDKGCLVLLVGITNGFIFGKLAWMEGKKPDEVHPFAFQEVPTSFDEQAFLPLIYGSQYDGKNYTPGKYLNELDGGVIAFYSKGQLELANQQAIDGSLVLINKYHLWVGELKGKAKGLEEYTIPIERSPEAELYGESKELVLDKEWQSGSPDSEDGVFTVKGQLRASYREGVFDFFGSASYSSKRIQGEVNIAATTESEAQQLFAQHAPAERVAKAAEPVPLDPADDTKEPLALTAWGNLKFKLIDKKTAAPSTGGAAAAGKKVLPEDLEGEGAFAVSPDGYIILSGKLKLPAQWQFTDKQKYTSADPDADQKLFEKRVTVARAPVPFGTVGLDIEIGVDAEAQLDPLELYEIEISGVYSNHPEYRSELGITPRFYISGYAAATVTAKLIAAYRLFGVFKVGEFSGDLTGTARADAYIDAAPTVKLIWNDKDSPASYAIAGKIHSGGKLTFTLNGNLSVSVLKKEIAKTEDYGIGTWTIGSFGLALNLSEYVIGSGDTPKFDYSKIGFGEKQRESLGNAIAKEKEGKGEADKRTGGFTQVEEGKEVEKGTFSEEEPTRRDMGADVIDNVLEQDFLMQDRLHELSLTFSGTRDNPKALIEMASDGKKPLDEKIAKERAKLGLIKGWLDKDSEKQIEQRQKDLVTIEEEAKSVKKNAEQAAQKVEGDEEPAVAGFDRLDDRLTSYGKKYEVDDLGEVLPTLQPVTAPAAPPSLRIPKSTGASSEMERRLKEKREDVGYTDFQDFRGSNVAVFRYNVLKPGSTAVTKSTVAGGPFYEASVNTSSQLHSEVIILGMLQNIHASPDFRKEFGPAYIIQVDQVLSERSPCFQCQAALRQKSTLISTSNYHNFYIVHYSGDWIARNRSLMIKYGLTPPPLEELRKLYGRGDKDPH